MSVNKVLWSTATFICLHTVYGCFHNIAIGLSSYDRDAVQPAKQKILPIHKELLLTNKIDTNTEP